MDDSTLAARERAADSGDQHARRDASGKACLPPEPQQPSDTEQVGVGSPRAPAARAGAGEAQPGDRQSPGAKVGLTQVIEALLFASDAPLSAARLAELAGAGTARQVRTQIEQLNAKYAAAALTFRVVEIARGYQMMTLPAYRAWLARLDRHRRQTRLSDAALETLSIVAYKQPIIRAEIEAIRGVACGEVLSRLRELGLVRVVGRAEVVGRPMLYGTTRRFLDVFGLASLEDLPPLEEQLPAPQSRRPAGLQPPAPPPSAEPCLAGGA